MTTKSSVWLAILILVSASACNATDDAVAGRKAIVNDKLITSTPVFLDRLSPGVATHGTQLRISYAGLINPVDARVVLVPVARRQRSCGGPKAAISRRICANNKNDRRLRSWFGSNAASSNSRVQST